MKSGFIPNIRKADNDEDDANRGKKLDFFIECFSALSLSLLSFQYFHHYQTV